MRHARDPNPTLAAPADALVWKALSLALAQLQQAGEPPEIQPLPPLPVVDEALWLARGQQLEPLVALGLARMTGEDHAQASALRVRAAASAAVSLSVQRQLSNGLWRAGVRHAFLKGAAANARWWHGAAWRGSLDVDVLVHPTDGHVARGVLAALGWTPARSVSHPVTQRAGKELTYMPPDARAGVPVDLHTAAVNDPPLHDDTAGILARAQHLPLRHGGTLMVPEPEDMLWLAAGNLAGDRFLPRYKQAVDAWCLLVREPVDFALVQQRARAAGCDWALWALLRLVQVRLGAMVPQPVLTELAPPAWVLPAVETVAGIHGPPPRPLGRWRRLFQQDWVLSQRAGWPLHAAARWAVLRGLDRAAVWAARTRSECSF